MLENHDIVQYAITKLYLSNTMKIDKSILLKFFFLSKTELNTSYNCQKAVRWMADEEKHYMPQPYI